MTDLHARELRRKEWEAEEMRRDNEPDSCHWRVSGPLAEIANSPDYQALNSQAIHEQVERSKWAMVQAALLNSKQELSAIAGSYDGERKALLVAMALEHDARIGAADAKKNSHQRELDRLRAEMKQLGRS